MVRTFGVDLAEPGAPAQTAPAPPDEPATRRIALLLPLRSATLGPAAQALRAGFMAAYERESAGFSVNLIESGEAAQEVLDAYAQAVEQNDIIVGPLARAAVAAVASSPALSKPTVALNRPDKRSDGSDVEMPEQLLLIGLSGEDEARQVAGWAAAEHPGGAAMIIASGAPWQRRIAAAFAQQWRSQGGKASMLELGTASSDLSEAALAQLQIQVENEQPTLLFAALDAEQTRQVRNTLGRALPLYGTASLNPGGSALADLDGVRLLDLPWQVQPDHPAVMVYPHLAGAPQGLDMERLYALGIDAFRVARALALQPSGQYQLDGVTGQLNFSFGRGPARFERVEAPAVVRAGAYTLVGGAR